ncbi:hypothetical protein KP004_07885 [Geomonas oryzisoli]|uniref:Glycosyltransferase RgtA/B/C/D-like domain-containing protein n=1 Tax=Geomonas oryzisoli TaxID=2847992 RepID=A0ABX8JDC8_9BACT|nr:hypothetical protein [Geomonas oryzisoli]QWV95086.1 hypothetical protein KP004_07885 [Geomonas oryzisoli]
MLPYLAGLGALLFLVCGDLLQDVAASDCAALQGLANALIFGVLVNHFLVLLLPGLEAAAVAGSFLSGAAVLALAVTRRPAGQLALRWLLPSLVLYLACCYLVTCEPVSGWDARSIWFFHAKMVFYNGSVDAGGDWTLPSMGFSHTDYPLLIPILAAQVASVAGFWNEYLPKMSLAALLLPASLFLLSMLGRRWWHLVFISLPVFFLGPWLTNGYMDGYVALYAGFGCFFLGRWIDGGGRLDLVSGVLAAGVVLDLKNEGMLYVVIVATVLCCFLLLKRRRLSTLHWVGWWKSSALLFVVVSGWVLWEREKHFFQLKNDLQLGLGSLATVQHRLSEGALPVILKYLYVTDNVNLSLGIFLLSLIYKVGKKEHLEWSAAFCALTAVIYFCGIVTIYLATPHDLISFHLPTGDRTMLPVHIMLLTAAFSLFAADTGVPAH